MTALKNRIEPFRGLLYNAQIAGDPALLISPPYDLIGAERQRELYARSQYNVVRLELSRDQDPYAAAARTLADWTSAGVLERARRPAIYLYSQTFELDGCSYRRSGFVVRIKLDEFSHGRILPHERTFPAAKEDRFKLLSAIRTNVSPIFGLYSAEHPALDRLSETVSSRAPIIDLVDDLKIRNELRAIEDPAEIALVQRELSDPRILIADGHHRYETALNYARARRASCASSEPQPFEYVMMTLVACGDPGLVILPTHRIAKRLPQSAIESFAARAREVFEVEETADVEQMRSRAAASGRGTIGVALRGVSKGFLLRLRNLATLDTAMPSVAREVRRLDVSVLHALVLERIFSVTAEQIRGGGVIDYSVDARAALSAVSDQRADGAFLMNPPSIADVEAVSAAGATMPEKSTYFYPKLLTGLVMNPLDESAGAP